MRLCRRLVVVLNLVAVLLVRVSPAAESASFTPVLLKGRLVHPTRLLARVKTGAQATAHASTLTANGMRVTHGYDLVAGLVVLEVDPKPAAMAAATAGVRDGDVQAALLQERIAALRASGLFEYVEPDHLVFPDATPTDSAFTNGWLWGLRNTGQLGGVPGVDIDAVRAWDLTTGSASVIVAIVDSGIRYTHVDLAAQMWRNPGEIPNNGLDDDLNGFVDDVHGINAVNDTGDPMDDHGHGSHVAGTIGAAANNGQQLVGVAWNVRLMACKFFDADDGGTFSDLLQCYDYAVANGARILNCSFGSPSDSRSERDALAAARDQGVLVVAAAGNDSVNNDYTPHFPSSYDLENIISVAAIDRFGNRATFSNIGAVSVDLGAPGVEIYSTIHSSDSAYATYQGTSMAAPHVVGVAALVRARFPGISVTDLRDRLLGTTIAMSSLQGVTVSGGRVNAYQALTANGDGQLKLEITPVTGTAFVQGRSVPVSVRVKDLVGVTGATVTGTIAGGGALTFLDNGVAPDAVANDGRYTATLNLPGAGMQLSLTVNASAPGKTGASASVTYTLRPPPPNDHFANRTTLSFNNGSVTADNFGGTLEPGEPLIAGENGGASLWWTWTAPANAAVTISTEGSNFDTLLGVYTGASVGALTEIASNDDISGPDQPSKVMFSALAGTTYQIVVDGWEGKTGRITLNVATTIPPTNDNFADRSVVSGAGFSVSGTNLHATLEAGEPVPPHFTGYHSVWWTWTAPSSGRAVVMAQTSMFVGNVSVYTGATLAGLVRSPGLVLEDTSNSNGQNGQRTFAAVAGVTYQIAVSSAQSGLGGSYTLNLALSAAPTNDLFINATMLGGTSATIVGNNINATREAGEPVHANPGYGATVWWKWTAPFDGKLDLIPNESGTAYVVTAYTGAEVAALTRVGSSQDPVPGNNRLRIAAVGGTTYYFAVDTTAYYWSPGAFNLTLTLIASPPNDHFANRIALTGASAEAAGTNAGATWEPGETHAETFLKAASIWWSWTAPATGTAQITATGSDPWVMVYTGASLAALQRVTNSVVQGAPGRNLRMHVEAGVEYQIAVDTGWAGAEGPITLAIEFSAAPANDLFTQRIPISGTANTITGSTVMATADYGENSHGHTPVVASVWWAWTVPAAGTALIDLTSGDLDLNVGVYTGDVVYGLTRVADNFENWYGARRVAFQAQAGVTYHLAVNARGSQEGSFVLNLSLNDPPTNDLFANRVTIPGNDFTVIGSNRGAWRESGEPSYVQEPQATVWWTWTPTRSGTATITTQGTAFDHLLAVFTGPSLAGLSLVRGDNGLGRPCVITFPAVAGTAYHISFDGYQRAMGDITLGVSVVNAPTNDSFAGTAPLTAPTVNVTGNNRGATFELNEPSFHLAGGSLWWSWTAPGNGAAAISTAGSAIATMLTVFRGNDPTSLTPLTGAQAVPGDDQSPRVTVPVVAGTTYRIQVLGLNSAVGDVLLAITYFPPPPNDAFAARTALSGTTLHVDATSIGATTESGEPESLFYTSGSGWWTWTAPSTGTATVWLEDPTGSLRLEVFRGTALGSLTRVFNSERINRSSRSLFPALAGTTYQIAVANFLDSAGAPFGLNLSLAAAPANDMFASRSTLTGASVSVVASHAFATLEEAEPDSSWTWTTASLWWSWTAPASGRVVLRANSPVFPSLQVFTGNSFGSLHLIPAGGGLGSQVIFDAVAGTTYQIRVATAASPEPADVTLHIDTAGPPPANDAFATRAALAGHEHTITVSNLGATGEAGEPNFSSGYAPGTMWWTWTAPADGRAVVDLRASDFLAVAGIYTGVFLGQIEPVELTNYTQTPGTRLMFWAEAGTAYQILVDGYHGGRGEVVLQIALHDPPENDLFADRVTLTGAAALGVGSNRWAGIEPDEPTLIFDYQDASVWWSWTAPADGVVAIDTMDSELVTRLGVFTGSTVSSLEPVTPRTHFGDHDESTFATFSVTAGMTLQIGVDAVGDEQGDIVLFLEMFEPPINDNFVTRRSLSGPMVTTAGSNVGASRETLEPWLHSEDGGSSVWWSWTAPATGPYLVSTAGSDFDTILGVFRGDALEHLTHVATNDDAHAQTITSAVVLNALAGTTYQICVSGKDRAAGAVLLDVSWAAPVNLNIQLPGGAIVAGPGLTLTASAAGPGPHFFQWLLNGQPIAGATGSVFFLPSVQNFHAGSYAVRVSNTYGSTVSDPVALTVTEPPPSNARLTNLSTRALALTGDNVLIPGFVVAGSGSKHLLIRAVGPTLAGFGVPGTLPDPRLVLKRWNGAAYDDVATNDDWGTNPNAAEIIAKSAELFAFPLNAGSADAALLVDLAPGQYSAVASGSGTQTGIAIVELYDADLAGGNARLINISNRGYVGAGASIMIPGFVVSDEGPKTLLIRAVGPTLSAFGVAGVLADPALTIYRRNQTAQTEELILTNDDWSIGPGAQRTRDVAAQIQAFALPEGSKDAAFVVTLNPGIYTVHARGVDDTTGVALVEVYAVP